MFQLMITAGILLAYVSKGFDTGIISGASPLIESNFKLTVAETGFVTSAVLIGSAAGALGVGPLADRFGRKKLLILASLFFIAGVRVIFLFFPY
ncbi:MFS transporter [Weissella confusa]|uniref:MFS transporter n=1 Tax=Weissella confusa TaxID=1583 RepID=A0A923NE68_WEICO|nr:MFS transporter [Weissella confusa]